MNLYRAVGLQEAGLLYDSGMKAFPTGLPQQPIFYPVLQLEYASQIASDWCIKNGEFAGYVAKFTVDDQYAERFEEHPVGDSSYQELWISADELKEFNNHITGQIKIVEAYFGETFQGFIPDTNGLQGKNAIDQFTLLTSSFLYKRMDFFLEIRRNHKAVFLNYPFWQKYSFKNPGLKEKILKAIKEAWLTAFPANPLMNYVQEDRTRVAESDTPLLEEMVEEEDVSAEEPEAQPLAHPLPKELTPIKQPELSSDLGSNQQASRPPSRFTSNFPVKPVDKRPKVVEPHVSHFEEGVKLGLMGDYRGATGELAKAVEEDPNHYAAFTSLGVAYHKLGEDSRAISCYEKALKINPKYADAHYFRANIFYNQGNDREAIAGYTIAMGLKPELINAYEKPAAQDRLTDYTSLSAGIYRIAKSSHRILDLNKMLETNPSQVELLKERAIEYSRLLNYEQTIVDYDSALTFMPEDGELFHLRGLAYARIGQEHRALQDYQRAIALRPQIVDEYTNRGIAFANAGNFRQAVASLTEAVRLAPENPDIYFNRGISYFQSGELENAINDFSIVIQLSPKDEDAYYWRGISFEEAGRPQDAQADFLQFLNMSQNMQARQELEQRLKHLRQDKQNDIGGRNVVPGDEQIGSEETDRHLYHLITALGERALHSGWFGSGVIFSGETAEELLSRIEQKQLIPGQDFLQLAYGIRQITEGDFIALDPGSSSHWILIRAWEGRGFYIEVNDPKSSRRLRSLFRSVEELDGGDPAYESFFIHM